MKTEMVAAKGLQTGDRVQGGHDSVWEIVEHVLPFNEGTTYLIEFQHVETGEKLTRYVESIKRYPVLTP